MQYQKKTKVELFNDHFQNYKRYHIPKAQLVIADIPYNVGNNAYGSNPSWYIDGDNKNGESELAGKQFFDTDKNFNLAEYMHFCSKMLIPEPKERGKAPCMIVFCSFEQQPGVIEKAQMTLGELLKEKRQNYNLTQKEVADKIGVPLNSYQRWEYDVYIPESYNLLALINLFKLDDYDMNKTRNKLTIF